jgi:plasmid maintenance system killer protein
MIILITYQVTNRMDLSFATRKFERELADERAMKRAYGERSPTLRNRLSVLAVVQKLEQLTGDRDEQFSVRLTKNWRLVFVADHNPIPRRGDRGIDLDQVTAIRLLEVVDYHRR